MEILKKVFQWVILLFVIYTLILVTFAIYDDRRVDFWPPVIYEKGTGNGTNHAGKAKKSVHEKIETGKEFLLAFSVMNARETNCIKPEDDSPLGDFLVGGVYKVRYNKSENKFYTKGLNQGLAGCPSKDAPSAKPGSDLNGRTIILWGGKFTFDDLGLVYKNDDHVGYILFPPGTH